MRRLPLVLTAATTVVCAEILLPVRSGSIERTPIPIPLLLPSLGAPAAFDRAIRPHIPSLARRPDIGIPPQIWANSSQTMGAGEVDLLLEPGDPVGGEAVDVGDDGEDVGGGMPPEDPFAEEEPIDERSLRPPGEWFVEYRDNLSEGALEPRGPIDRAEVARLFERIGNDPEDGLPDEPSDEPIAEPHSVLWYLDNGPTPAGVLAVDDTPPATRLPAYDLLDEPAGSTPPDPVQDATKPEPILEPGVYVHAVDAAGVEIRPGVQTLGSVVLGQPFHVSVAVPLGQADPNGDGVFDDLTITLATEDGEATVTLAHDPLQNTTDGMFVYRTATPISLAGRSQGFEVPQIVDVGGVVEGLDLDSYEGASTVTITAGDQAFGAVDVYTNNTQRGIGMIGEGLDGVTNVLVGEIALIRRYRSDPRAQADSKIIAELDAWQARVDERMAVVQRARTLLADPDAWPIVKLEIGQFYLERLYARDESGRLEVADRVVPFRGDVDVNSFSDLPRMDSKVSALTNGIRQRVSQGLIEDVLPAYLLGFYDQYNTWNVPGAFAWTLGGALAGESTDHFGREKSVSHAAVEMGLFVVMIRLPDALTDWAAGGFGANRLPSIGVPRFRGTPIRGNVLVPKRAGRLALETRGGTQAYPGSATRPIHSLPHAERVWWHGFVASKTPTMQFDDAMAATARELDELNAIVQNAQRLGVPYAQIEGALASARVRAQQATDAVQGLRDGISQVKRELVIHGVNADRKTIVVHHTEMQEFRDFSEGLPVTSLRQEDLLMIQGIKSRAEFEARHKGKPMYNPDEVAYARELLQHGDELKNWLEFSSSEGGVRYMFDDAAIADLRTVFGGAGPPANRISPRAGFQRFENRQQVAPPEGPAPPANPFSSRGDTPDLPPGGQAANRPPTQELTPTEMEQAILNAETVRFGRPAVPPRAQDARPLATLEEYRALVGRQAAGEALDLKQIARPGIARVLDGRVLIQQGSGRWENTRPNDWLDLFVDARAPLPDGAVVLQRGVSPELVRQANLLSSRGQSGSNPTIVNTITTGIPEFVRIRVRARDVQAPMSDVAQAIDDELTRLAADGVDLARLQIAMEPLSPNERLALLRNEATLAETVQEGIVPLPPPPPPPPPPPTAPPGAGGAAAATPSTPAGAIPRLSELDRRVIQKGFKEAGGQAVEWTPEELTRLQQIAYPSPGMRPSVLQRRLMPVAEQRGGRLDTMRVDPDDIGAVRGQANDAFLAKQELEDMIDLARQFGVPEERIALQTQGLTDDAPATVLERASRGLLREVDQARGIVYESGVPDDFFVVTRMYFAGRANGNRLLDADVAWLKERMDADDTFIQRLATREFEDAAGEAHTIMDPTSAQQLESMYRSATGGGGAPVSQGPPPTVDPGSGGAASILGGPSGRGGADAPVEVVILSTEGSTGPVMEAFFVNRLGQALRIQGEGIVLEPVASVDPATMQRIEQIREAALQGKPVPGGAEEPGPHGPLERWAGGSVVRVVLDAYCLEADLDVPTRGMLYRIAEPARQAAFGSLKPILEASQRLHEQGALHPSNDPVDYFHSIRQWALWADEKDMDEEEFEDAFTEHARRNITGSGQAWTPEVERVVRDFAPGRWGDVEAVLEAAGVR